MSRTLNVDRMRRYRSRGTPDVLNIPDTAFEDGRAKAMLDAWGLRMETRHGHRISGESWRELGRSVTSIGIRPEEGCVVCERGGRR